MSEVVNINNSLFEFDLYLLNIGSDKNCCIPISKGMLRYLEIEDTLAKVGVQVKAQITNFYGLLQKFKILDVTKNANCFNISIKNRDYDAISNDVINELQFLTTFNKNIELSKNAVDKDFIFEAEEYFIHALKTQKFNLALSRALAADLSYAGIATSITKLIEGCISVSDELKGKERILNIQPLNTGVPPNAIAVDTDTLHDIIEKCYPYIYYEGEGPGILNITNVSENNTIYRKFNLQSIGSLTAGLYQQLNANSNDLSQYLVEKFVMQNSVTNTVLGSNVIKEYNIIRQDQTTLLENKWGDYFVKEFSDGTTATTPLNYESLVEEFEKVILGNLSRSNLPELDSDRNIFNVPDEINNRILTENKIKSTVLKSFIFDNIAISFKCEGQLYRTPGKFIEIRMDDTVQGTDNLNGYWFIISIKHIFEGDTFKNEIICVKFNQNGEYTPILKPTRSPQIPNSNNTAPEVQETEDNIFTEPILPEGDETDIIDGGVLPLRLDVEPESDIQEVPDEIIIPQQTLT